MRSVSRLFTIAAAALALLAAAAVVPAALRAQSDERCFEQTGFCISGRIHQFWEQNGGLPAFGYPIGPLQTMTIEGRPIQAQWFERNRLELHPEKRPPYDVLLGRLGDDRLVQQGRDWRTFPANAPASPTGCRFFPETGRTVCGLILSAWRAQGLEFDGRPGASEAESLALWGLPLSDPQVERIQGSDYTVQWFERARFELHPENQPPYNVLLGLLGSEVLPGNTSRPPQPSATSRPTQPTITPILPPTGPLDRRDAPPGGVAGAGALTFDAISCEASDQFTSPPLTLDPQAPTSATGELGQRISLCFLSDGVTPGQFARDTLVDITVAAQGGGTIVRQQVAPLPDSDFNALDPGVETSFIRWRWTPPAVGVYDVTARQGDLIATGTVQVLPATQPRYAAVQRVFRPGDNELNRRGLTNYRPGDTAEILLAGFPPNAAVGMLLYGPPPAGGSACPDVEGVTFTACYLTRAEVTTDAGGGARLTFPVPPGSPAGVYLLYWEGEPAGTGIVSLTGFQPNIFAVLPE
ncbi:MAG: hypothetical protein RLZZ387_4447 [Chloroflexota bacterium]|jgi:hypothetical protein